MDRRQENGMEEFSEASSAAAQAVRGAIKTGKAVSGAAKGAAVGGPYGAAAGLLWESRKHIGKIVTAVAVILMLPVLFVAMIPSLLFGGLTSSDSPADPGTPVMNSAAAVTENANAITFAISGILGEALEDILIRIEADFAESGGDRMEVINPHASRPVYNVNLFVSQYCAFRETDYGCISIEDMTEVLRHGREHLYSYKRREEQRQRTETDPKTGKEVILSEKWMVYTISYNGENYFADSVFGLSDEQKDLAADYAQNMGVLLGDGLLQNLAEWKGNAILSLGDICFQDGAAEVVYFNQMDERYASQPYGTDNIGGYGCGPACMAMVVSSLTEENIEPTEMAQWAYENGYWCKGSGSYHALIPGAAENWGLAVSGCTASEPQRILDALAEGKLVVAIMSKGHFTRGGHFIVLRGIKDGKVMVADPASYKRSGQMWDLSVILSEASRRAGAGGPFWIIG